MLLSTALLSSCSQVKLADNALNTSDYCQIENVIFAAQALNMRRISNTAPEGMSLCFDPLCTHDEAAFCAELKYAVSVVTEGKRLYVKNLYPLLGKAQITSLKPDGSERKTLCEFSYCDGLVTKISTDGKYVYFVEGLYKDPEAHGGDSYGVPMRVPCGGGDAEAFLDGEYTAFAQIYADKKNYYVLDNGMLSVIDRKNGERIDAQLPTSEVSDLILHDGNVYLYGIAEYHEYQINCRFEFQRKGLWKWNGTEFEAVLSDIDQLVWDTDGVWYTQMLAEEDFVLVGSSEHYDGRGQSSYDFVRTWTGEVVYYDLSSGEKTVYKSDNINLKIEPKGVASGYIIAAVCDYTKLSVEYEYVNLKPNANGTISICEAVNNESEM